MCEPTEFCIEVEASWLSVPGLHSHNVIKKLHVRIEKLLDILTHENFYDVGEFQKMNQPHLEPKILPGYVSPIAVLVQFRKSC